MCTITTYTSASGSSLLIVTPNTLIVPPSHSPTKTGGSKSGKNSYTGSKLVPGQLLPNINDTITITEGATTTADADSSVDTGGVKGRKVATNTNKHKSFKFVRLVCVTIAKIYSMLDRVIAQYKLFSYS